MGKATKSKVSPEVDSGGLPFILTSPPCGRTQDDQTAPLTPGDAPSGSLVPLRGTVSGHVAKGGRKRERERREEKGAGGGVRRRRGLLVHYKITKNKWKTIKGFKSK